MSKLYKVKVEIEMMVMSEDSQGAINEAYDHVFKELEEYGIYIPTEVRYKSEVPVNWVESIPYAGTKLCKDLIVGMPADEPIEVENVPPKPSQLERPRPPLPSNPVLDFGSFIGRPTKRKDSGIVDNR